MNDVTEYPVDEATALSEFNRFADAMDIDIDTTTMDEQDLRAFQKQRNRMTLAIRKGALIVNEDGEAVYTPRHPRTKNQEPLTFQERTGASLMVMDGKKKNHDVAKTYAIMGDLCGVHPNRFATMAGTDIKVCEAIFAFLMD